MINGLLNSINDPMAKTKVTLKEGDQTITVERTPEQPKEIMSIVDVIAPGSHGLLGGEVSGFSPTPVADNIPIDVTAGEFVVNQPAAQKYAGLLEDINNEGQEMLARGGWTGPSKYNDYAGGGKVLSDKISKIYNEGYKAPGQAYAIAKNMGYNQGGYVEALKYYLGGEVMPQLSPTIASSVRQHFAIGGQVDPAASMWQQTAAAAPRAIGRDPFRERQWAQQDDALARQRQLEDRAYQAELAEETRGAQYEDFTKRQDYLQKLKDEEKAREAGITFDSRYSAVINGERVPNVAVGRDRDGNTMIEDPVTGQWRRMTPSDQLLLKVGTGSAETLGAADKKAIRQTTSNARTARRLANNSLDIIDEIVENPGEAGITRSFERTIRRLGGSQNAKDLWESRINGVALQAALANKPPGPITERELAILLGTVPDENARPEVKQEWLYGIAIANLTEAAYEEARADYLQENFGSDAGFEEAWLDSPEYRELKAQLAPIESQMASIRTAVRGGGIKTPSESPKSSIPGFNIKRG